eukprot:723036-Pelagomonas_calceolata.AAC.1
MFVTLGISWSNLTNVADDMVWDNTAADQYCFLSYASAWCGMHFWPHLGRQSGLLALHNMVVVQSSGPANRAAGCLSTPARCGWKHLHCPYP